MRHPYLVLLELTAGVACPMARIVETTHLHYCSVVKVDTVPHRCMVVGPMTIGLEVYFRPSPLARYMRLL